jgi:hypothetical protein
MAKTNAILGLLAKHPSMQAQVRKQGLLIYRYNVKGIMVIPVYLGLL